MKNRDQTSIFPETNEEKKRRAGYSSLDYINGYRAPSIPRTEPQAFVRYFLETIYKYRGIDYYIPKYRIVKCYTRAKAVIEKLGTLERAKNYIDWFITNDSFIRNAFNYDLMVTGSVVDRFEVSDKGKKIDASPGGYIRTIEDAKNNKGGTVL